MTILQDGKVGIETTSPSKLLDVASAAMGSGIACSSDERLKENFQDISGEYALERLTQLQAVSYNFKTAPDSNRRTGYKAQEVQKIAPEFVRENDDGFLQVYYDAFIPWITEAIKTLSSRTLILEREIASVKTEKADQSEVDRLKLENEKLKQENSEIKARLDAIEKRLR